MNKWLIDGYDYLQNNFDDIKAFTIYVNKDRGLKDFTSVKEDFEQFCLSYMDYVTSFKYKHVLRVEFFFNDGSVKEFLPPNE